MKLTYNVKGMSCSACSSNIEKNISALRGVKNVNVNLLKNNMTVDYDENILSSDEIINSVNKIGYTAFLPNEEKNNEIVDKTSEDKKVKFILVISLIFAIPLFYLSMGPMIGLPVPSILSAHYHPIINAFTQFLLVLPIVFVNFKYYTNGYKSLFNRAPNMDSLVAISTTASLLYGIYAIYKMAYGMDIGDIHLVHRFAHELYFEGTGMILALITLGKYLEHKSKGKTSEAINQLINLTPKVATVLIDGEEKILELKNIKVGDTVIVKSGETVPLDSEVIEGNGFIDESSITGESMPVEKNVGDNLIGATIVKSGYFKVKILRVGEDTLLAKIIKIVDEATTSKAPIARLADKISGKFVPFVIGISLLTFVVWMLLGKSLEFSLSMAISVLVISCPCALGLATPTAIMVAIGRGATNGILIKSAESLELMHSIKNIVFDKTGTITEGSPFVNEFKSVGSESEEQLLQITASIENLSEHPLSKAIVNEFKKKNTNFLEVKNFKQIYGQGISAEVENKTYYIGNEKMMKNISVVVDEKYKTEENSMYTILYVASEKNLEGIISIADKIKNNSVSAIKNLKNMGIKTIMLTGDNKHTANSIGKIVGVDEIISEVLPTEKADTIKKVQERNGMVAMVGDGINDAPALATANVGIAIGAGTDIAIESANIVLMNSDLQDVTNAIYLSKATIRNIKQNLFWAFIYNVIGIPIAAGIFYHALHWKMNPMFAAFAMSCSSLFVVMNALRLRKIKFEKEVGESKMDEVRREEFFKKTIYINGMMCSHCTSTVEKILNSIDGVKSVKVSLENKNAEIESDVEISDEILKEKIIGAGYEVVEIK